MKIHRFHSEFSLPRPLSEVFPFFADAGNLEAITPAFLKFHIVGAKPEQMHVGARITYQLKLHGIPIRWKSEITAWEPPYRFVDEQLSGPYRLWHHEHTFIDEGNARIIDTVEYAVYFDFLVHRFVRPDIERIFAYRLETLRKLFGE